MQLPLLHGFLFAFNLINAIYRLLLLYVNTAKCRDSIFMCSEHSLFRTTFSAMVSTDSLPSLFSKREGKWVRKQEYCQAASHR